MDAFVYKQDYMICICQVTTYAIKRLECVTKWGKEA